jgi:hypothetical protein
MPIAESASLGQIVSFGFAAVLATNDVIDLAPKERIVFADQTILAEMVGTGRNREPNLSVRTLRHCPYVDGRELWRGA